MLLSNRLVQLFLQFLKRQSELHRQKRKNIRLITLKTYPNYFFKTGKVDNAESILKLGVLLGVIKQSGAFYSYDILEKVKGKEGFLREVLAKGILEKLKEAIINSNLAPINECDDDVVQIEEQGEDDAED